MIPYNTLVLTDKYTRLVEPESLKKTGLVDYEKGGVALGDSSEGLNKYDWTFKVVNKTQGVLSRDGFPETIVYEFSTKPIDVAFCFDQSMNIVIAWQDKDFNLYLRRYNSTTNSFQVLNLGIGKCPRLTLDEKRSEFISNSDVILGYIANNTLLYRVQREGYLIIHTVEQNMLPSQRLARIGVKGFRLQFVLTPRG